MRIERLRNTYLAPRDHPAPERIRSQLDDAARSYVGESCGRALSAMLDESDPSVWVIENVSVDLLMDLSALPVEEVATFWAQRIAESVARTVARGADGERVLHFPSRAAYLARFLRDLATGTAWGKWHYAQFDSLRSLPAAAAIREALLREPMLAEPALFHLLETNDLEQVVRCLSERDQDRVLQLLAPDETLPSAECFATVLNKWISLRRGAFLSLEHYIRLRVENPEYRTSDLRGAIRHLYTIEQWMQHSQFGQIRAELATNGLFRLLERLTGPEQETASFMYFQLAANPEVLARIDELACDSPEGAVQRSQDSVHTRRMISPVGGIFLLLPTFLKIPSLMRLYGRVEDAYLRFLLLLCCTGGNFRESWRDPALLLAAGLEEMPDLAALPQVQINGALHAKEDAHEHDLQPNDIAGFTSVLENLEQSFSPNGVAQKELATAAAALMRGFARTLPALARSSFEYLRRNVLAGDARITATPGRILVQLAPRPLQIVLRMAGFHDMSFSLPWEPETEVTIRLDEQ